MHQTKTGFGSSETDRSNTVHKILIKSYTILFILTEARVVQNKILAKDIGSRNNY